MERKRWYKDKVFYQIWPRSFKDGDGDGMGDLWGVYEKLDYIKSLGCDGIWFSPIYPSPGADCGYDISNYRDIAPEFGGMEAFKKVLEGAHARDMKVVMDLVVNHTSDEHEWFQKSRRRIDPYTDYYIWRPGKPGGKLPNNWDSFFEGKAWTFDEVRGEYYLHLFAVKQPDLNMDNPKVREEVKGILRFWLDMGVDGFREDVITYISKKEGLPDDHLMPTCKGMPHYNHGPRIHEYLSEFKHDVLDHYDCFTLAEAPMVTPKRALTYIDEKDGQLDMMIQFQCVAADCLFTDYLPMKFSLRRMKKAFSSCDRAKILGYTTQMNLYMKACDVLFTKPGGLTSTEGAVAGIPMVHTEPIPGCETANRKFFGRLGMSVSAKTIKGQVQAGLKLLSDKEAADEMIRRQQKNINKMAAEDICDFIKGKLTDEKALL